MEVTLVKFEWTDKRTNSPHCLGVNIDQIAYVLRTQTISEFEPNFELRLTSGDALKVLVSESEFWERLKRLSLIRTVTGKRQQETWINPRQIYSAKLVEGDLQLKFSAHIGSLTIPGIEASKFW